MNKYKIVSILAIILLAINLILVAFLFLGRPKHPKRPRQEIIKSLNLDQDQIEKYNELIEKHQEGVVKIDDEIGEAKKSLFSLLTSNNTVARKDSIIQVIGQKQMQIEQLHFAHFESLHSLCKPEQE